MSIFAPCSRASATRNSSLRVLFPPKASPVWSSRLIRIRGLLNASERRGSSSIGVGRWAEWRCEICFVFTPDLWLFVFYIELNKFYPINQASIQIAELIEKLIRE